MINKFGERFAQLRNKHNVPRVDIAKILYVSKSTVGFWERESRMPSFDELIILSNLFGVSLDYLIGKVNEDEYEEIERINTFSSFENTKLYRDYKAYEGDYAEYLNNLSYDICTYCYNLIAQSKKFQKKVDGLFSTKIEDSLCELCVLATELETNIHTEVFDALSAISDYENGQGYTEAHLLGEEKIIQILKETYPECSIERYSNEFIRNLFLYTVGVGIDDTDDEEEDETL